MYETYQSPHLSGELKTRWPEWSNGNARRAIAAQKRTIYEGDHLGMIKQYMRKTLSGDDLAQISEFASRSANIVRTVGDTVPVAYRRGCMRSLFGASEKTAKAFATLVQESGIVEHAEWINAVGWLTGPVIVTPHIDPRNRLGIDIITPDLLDLKRSGKYIDAALWKHGGGFIELDDSAYRYFDEKGNLYDEKPHTAGICPAAAFVSMDNPGDFWNTSATLGLVDVTLQTAVSLATMRWVRQVSGNNLTVTKGNIDDIPPGQSVGSQSVGVVLTDLQASVQVLPRSVAADDRLKEITNDIALAVSQYGIPASSVSMVGGQLAINVDGDRLSILRDRQVKLLLAAEREFWEVACEYVRTSSHKLANDIPPTDELRDMLRIEFPDLASSEDSKARIEAMAAGLPFGITSPQKMLAEARPERTPSEIAEEVQANLKNYVDVIKPLVERSTPADASQLSKGYQTLPQEQGAQGGQASGVTRAAIADAA